MPRSKYFNENVRWAELSFSEYYKRRDTKLFEGYAAEWIPFSEKKGSAITTYPPKEGFYWVVLEHKLRSDYCRVLSMAFWLVKPRKEHGEWLMIPMNHKRHKLYSVLMFTEVKAPSYPIECAQPGLIPYVSNPYIQYIQHAHNPSQRRFYSLSKSNQVLCCKCLIPIEFNIQQIIVPEKELFGKIYIDQPMLTYQPFCIQCKRSLPKFYNQKAHALIAWLRMEKEEQKDTPKRLSKRKKKYAPRTKITYDTLVNEYEL